MEDNIQDLFENTEPSEDILDLSLFIPNVKFELIPIKNLVSNQDYQRNLSTSHIRRTVESFDIYQVNPVKVSRRDGINYVFNGQHTIEIIAAVSNSRETPVWCMVYDDMDYTMEADVFANQQKCVKPLVPYEIFMANLEAGNDMQLIIKDLVESYQLVIGATRGINTICAVSSLEYIYEKFGFHVLDRTLRLTVSTWEGEPYSLSSNMLKGIARLIVAFGDKLRDDLFKDKVGIYSAKDITRTAKERASGSMGYAEAMLLAYNKKMRYPLRWANLYSNKKAHLQETFEFSSASDDYQEADEVSLDDAVEETFED
ncbi:MAG: hypothetical protein E7523_00565 [Ruminococcaceae bacterium]|nr:hypothetical protein [Oscillospiraceae bacterium]MBQ3517957.1 hypothetical protein [Clostridia bacterium]